jgi:Flp pilus assembly protein CpaB
MQMVQRMLATRGGTMTVGAFAAGFAALLLVLYLSQYRSSLNDSNEPITVLVAKSLIEKGTPGDIVGVKGLFQATEVKKGQVKEGAITDPGALRGREATNDIFPGQPLTTQEFAASTRGAIGSQIAGNQRALAVPVDPAHGLVGQVRAGDRVDVVGAWNITEGTGGGGRPVVKVLTQNILVLNAPDHTGPGVAAAGSVNVVLRTSYREAAEIAWVAENGKVWVVLRPRAGSPAKKPIVVTGESLLGVRAVGVRR